MKTLHILIVEDDPLVAMGLEMMVTEIVTATVVVKESVAAAKKILHDLLDFAFLDVNVTDGKTFEVAQILERKHVPFACHGSFTARWKVRSNNCVRSTALERCVNVPISIIRPKTDA